MAAAEISNLKVHRGKRSYFFDIKKTRKGDLYLLISESSRTDSGFDHRRLMIFEEDVSSFAATMEMSVAKIKQLKTSTKP